MAKLRLRKTEFKKRSERFMTSKNFIQPRKCVKNTI